MKKKVADLAGMSTPENITFFGEDGTSEVDTIDFKNPPRYYKDKTFTLFKKVKNIPIIRGYAVLFEIILSFLRFLFKNKLWLVLAFIILFVTFFKPEMIVISKEVKPGPLSNIIPNIFWDEYFFPLATYSIILTFIFFATKNHAAEHKAISAYDTTQNLSIKNIKIQPKENRRCGTVLVVWMLILSIPLFFVDFGSLIDTFLQATTFSLGYEVFLLARRKDKIGDVTYSLGWLGQKLTTREPDDKLLLRSRQGIMRLLDEEGYRYKR